ncbi:MAG TPA: glycosyltransferase, partial [Terriglobales bacterium]
MRILVAHNEYQQRGGEDTVVEQETALLLAAGHEVVHYKRSNFEVQRFSGVRKLKLLSQTFWARDTQRDLTDLLRRVRPDVVHVHNTFMMISPVIYSCCQRMGIPVVQTLHNYRLFCPASTFVRDGSPCEDCVCKTLLEGVRHRCYRGSMSATAAAAGSLAFHRARGTWDNEVDRFIALTEFARKKFVASGLRACKLRVKPNFVYPDPGARDHLGTDYAVFVGRLTSEKGIETAVNAWHFLPKHIRLKVIGDGPLMPTLERRVASEDLSHVSLAGRLSREQTLEAMRNARLLL